MLGRRHPPPPPPPPRGGGGGPPLENLSPMGLFEDPSCPFTGTSTYSPSGQDRGQGHTAPSHPAAEWGRALACRYCSQPGED